MPRKKAPVKEVQPVRRPGAPCKRPDPSRPAHQVGAAIRAARTAADLSVERAAGALGVPASRWYDWESGRAFPPLLQLSPLCQVLSCDLAEIVPA